MSRRAPIVGRLARAAALALLGAACARIVPPTGGPEDRSAPRIESVAPDSAAVRVPPEAPVRLTFSESMDRSSVRDWLQITPWPGRLQCSWEQRTFVCRAEEGWRAGTTYTVLLGTRAQDPRKNRLEAPLVLAFSTGDSLDAGELTGRVRTRSLTAEEVPLFVFDWPETLAAPLDSSVALEPDPLNARRSGESGKEGQFALRFLPRGRRFLLAALYDRDGDRAYDAGTDLWGFAAQPVVCGDSTRGGTETEIYLVYADEPGDLAGTVIDSACAGYVPPARLRATADSLGRILSGEVDAMGFPAGKGDTLPGSALTSVQADSLRAEAERVRQRLAAAMEESLRCGAAIWVTAIRPDSTIAGETRAAGPFELVGLDAGLYRLTAFRDLSGDGARQADEPTGDYPHAVELAPGRRVTGIDWEIVLAPAGDP